MDTGAGMAAQAVCTLSELIKNKMDPPPRYPPLSNLGTPPPLSSSQRNLLCYPIMYSRNVTDGLCVYFFCVSIQKNLLIPNTLFVGYFVLLPPTNSLRLLIIC
jgi:hypothetical protein